MLKVTLCCGVGDDVEGQIIRKTTKIVQKSAPSTGLSVITITAQFLCANDQLLTYSSKQ